MEQAQEEVPVAGEVLFRSFEPQQLAFIDDGRTVETRVVPYGVIAEVWSIDDQGGKRYSETFDRGSFSRAEKAPFRVKLQIDHVGGELVGFGRELMEDDQGLLGRFRLLETRAGLARELIQEFGYSGLSVGFIPLPGGSERKHGIVHRTAVHLDHVAVVPVGTEAYAGSRVLALRAQGGLLEGRAGSELPPDTPELDALSDRLQADRVAYETRLARMQAVLQHG